MIFQRKATYNTIIQLLDFLTINNLTIQVFYGLRKTKQQQLQKKKINAKVKNIIKIPKIAIIGQQQISMTRFLHFFRSSKEKKTKKNKISIKIISKSYRYLNGIYGYTIKLNL